MDSLTSLAALAEVQGIEIEPQRKAASDLTRVALGISLDTTNSSNYLNLTGSNIWVNINDTGIDTTHPALAKVPVLLPAPPLVDGWERPRRPRDFRRQPDCRERRTIAHQYPRLTHEREFPRHGPGAKLIALPLNAGGGTNGYPALNDKVLDTWLIDSAARTNYLALKRTNSPDL